MLSQFWCLWCFIDTQIRFIFRSILFSFLFFQIFIIYLHFGLACPRSWHYWPRLCLYFLNYRFSFLHNRWLIQNYRSWTYLFRLLRGSFHYFRLLYILWHLFTSGFRWHWDINQRYFRGIRVYLLWCCFTNIVCIGLLLV